MNKAQQIKLDELVKKDNTIVSVRFLCMQWQMSASDVRKVLDAYAKEDGVSATFCISGKSRASSGGRTMALVRGDELKTKISELFEDGTTRTQVYSVQAKASASSADLFAQQYAQCEELFAHFASKDHYAFDNRFGIKCAACKRRAPGTREVKKISKREETREDKEERERQEQRGVDTVGGGGGAAKETKAKMVKKLDKKGVKDFFGAAATKASDDKKKKKTAAASTSKSATGKEAAPPKKAAKKGSMQAFLTSRKGVPADDETKEKKAINEEAAPVKSSKKRKAIDSSDEEDEDEESKAKKKPSEKPPAKKKKTAAAKAKPKTKTSAAATTTTKKSSPAKKKAKVEVATSDDDAAAAVVDMEDDDEHNVVLHTGDTDNSASSNEQSDDDNDEEGGAKKRKKRRSKPKPLPLDQTTLEQFSPTKPAKGGGAGGVRVKRRKKVTRTEQFIDDKGFMRTRDIEESVTDSEASVEAAPPIRPTAVKSEASGTTDASKASEDKAKVEPAKKSKQSSIASFFTKKK